MHPPPKPTLSTEDTLKEPPPTPVLACWKLVPDLWEVGPRPATLKAVGGFSEHAAVCESSHQQPGKSVDQG